MSDWTMVLTALLPPPPTPITLMTAGSLSSSSNWNIPFALLSIVPPVRCFRSLYRFRSLCRLQRNEFHDILEPEFKIVVHETSVRMRNGVCGIQIYRKPNSARSIDRFSFRIPHPHF